MHKLTIFEEIVLGGGMGFGFVFLFELTQTDVAEPRVNYKHLIWGMAMGASIAAIIY
jgi:hypothetical protein